MVFARLTLSDYANTVLNVVKARFGLNDKSQAINKFIELYGEEVVEKDANDKYIKKLLEIEARHFKKYG
ncbi:MAG: antitoxin, partial [Nanoarchaeota archaeon]